MTRQHAMFSTRTRACLLATSLLSTACPSTWAPPSVVGVGVAPGAFGAGHGTARIGGGLATEEGVRTGTADVIIGVSDSIDVELGGAIARTQRDTIAMGMGHVGARFSLGDQWTPGGAVTLSAGLGVGSGGELNSDVQKHLAGGGYLGLDVGGQFGESFHLYLGNRLQMSGSRNTPATKWGIHVLGLQLKGSALVVVVEGGIAWFGNSATGPHAGIIGSARLGYVW